MPTKSITKQIIIRTKKQASRFIKALEKAEKQSKRKCKNVTVNYTTLRGSEITNLFGEGNKD